MCFVNISAFVFSFLATFHKFVLLNILFYQVLPLFLLLNLANSPIYNPLLHMIEFIYKIKMSSTCNSTRI